MGSRLTDLNLWPSLYNDSGFEIRCTAGLLCCVCDLKVNRLINFLIDYLRLTGISLWDLLSSLRASQVAQAKAGLVGNSVVDCALENMAA